MTGASVFAETSFALAFETSSDQGAVALGRGGDVLDVRRLRGPRRHATDFLPAVRALCRDHSVEPSGIGTIHVSVGPGSFTGLRIGVTAARAIALATGASLTAVPSLEVIAQNAMSMPSPPRRVAVLLDAKRGRVYAAAFVLCHGFYESTTEPAELDAASFLDARDRVCAVLGEGVLYHREAVDASGLAVLPESLNAPRADVVYRLGEVLRDRGQCTDRRALVPQYIRPPEAEEKWQARNGAP